MYHMYYLKLCININTLVYIYIYIYIYVYICRHNYDHVFTNRIIT